MKIKCLTLIFFLWSIVFVKAQGFFGKITNAVGSVVNTGVKITTAPYEAVINTGKVITGNASPSAIYKPYQEVATSAGSALPQVTGVISEPQRVLMQKAQEFSQSVGGNTGAFIFDVGTFSNRYYSELANAGANNINNILHGQNPFQLAAAPLAAAIRAARERHISSAQPLPANIKQALQGYFSDDILNRAKYTQGNIQITLPNFIGQGQKFMGGNEFAVVVDDIIVFNYSNPSLWHWAHELTHIQQYVSLGVEAFAFNYIRDAGRSIENEADNKANSISGTVQSGTMQTTASYLKVGSFDQSGYNDNTNYNQQPEIYVAQCVFPQDQFGAMYLVTNYRRIIAVNPVNGAWQHIGYSTPPLLPNVAWTYDLPNANWKYAVGNDGNIYTAHAIYNNIGQVINYNWVAIGYVVKL